MCKLFPHACFQSSLETFDNTGFGLWIFSSDEINRLSFQEILKFFILNSAHLSVCKFSSTPVKYFTDCSKAVLLLWIFYVFFFCLVFAMSLCASVYMCFVVTCWERADLLALVCGV